MAVVLLAIVAPAQIKIHSDGQVSLGSLSNIYGVQCRPSDYTSFQTPNAVDWSWVELSLSNASKQKHWIVKDLTQTSNQHTFFVTTDGYIYKRGSWRAADSNYMNEDGTIEGAGAILDSITGFWYIPIEDNKGTVINGRRVGISAQQVKKMLPEAVASDENGLLYVDYEALTVFLIEAMKDQRREIEILRKTITEYGILEQKNHKKP